MDVSEPAKATKPTLASDVLDSWYNDINDSSSIAILSTVAVVAYHENTFWNYAIYYAWYNDMNCDMKTILVKLDKQKDIVREWRR